MIQAFALVSVCVQLCTTRCLLLGCWWKAAATTATYWGTVDLFPCIPKVTIDSNAAIRCLGARVADWKSLRLQQFGKETLVELRTRYHVIPPILCAPKCIEMAMIVAILEWSCWAAKLVNLGNFIESYLYIQWPCVGPARQQNTKIQYNLYISAQCPCRTLLLTCATANVWLNVAIIHGLLIIGALPLTRGA